MTSKSAAHDLPAVGNGKKSGHPATPATIEKRGERMRFETFLRLHSDDRRRRRRRDARGKLEHNGRCEAKTRAGTPVSSTRDLDPSLR